MKKTSFCHLRAKKDAEGDLKEFFEEIDCLREERDNSIQELKNKQTEIESMLSNYKTQLIEIEGENGHNINSLKDKMREGKVPALVERNKCIETIQEYNTNLKKLGLFKGKEKKKLEELIAEVTVQQVA